MRRLFAFIFRPALLLVLGALCVALLIWFGGPLLAFADWRPLASTTARIVLIAILLVLWLGKRVASAIRQKMANRKLFDALSAKGAKPASESPADAAQIAAVRSRFEQALAVMKKTRLGADQSWFSRLFGGRRYVYQLPWYVFIGPPGSGKTTALLNSGLQFPLAEKLGNDPIRGVGGTRNCDWWFTDQAVMIDTAGRYTTQDSDAQTDSHEWGEFLKQLRKYRPRQPINGALVTVSVSDLLQLSAAERERQAGAVRARVQELLATLDNDFPVYLLVTKADLLAGFMEFFGDLDREQREAVWGTTFDYSPDAPKAPTLADFESRFDELARRIDELTLERLQNERDPQRRAAIHGFVHQLAAIRSALSEFVANAFPESRLARQPLFRGVYFTSGTQEGNPIDRVMGSIARQFGLQRRILAPLKPSGKAFFLTRLLREVVFAEAPLAGTNLRWERRLGSLKWIASVGAVVIAFAAITGWTLSYLNNRAYVAEVASRVATLKKSLDGQVVTSIDLASMLPLYAAVRTLPSTDAVDPAAPPMTYGFGLFQGAKLADAAEQAYHRLLAQTLAPALAERIAAVLRRGAANPELQYETLKTYVMLRSPEYLNPAAVKGWIVFDLETSPVQGFGEEQRRALLAHVDALLARSAFQDAVRTDDALIANVRATLARTPFPQRVYERIKRQGVGQFADFRISAAGGSSAALVFTRKSGAALTDGVPGLYTYDGYHKGFTKALDDVLRDLAAEEVWVLGIKDSSNARRAADLTTRGALVDDVKRLYLQDYAATWEQFIADIAVVRGAGLTQTIQTARVLSAPDSPLPTLLRAIVREVSLTESEGKSVVDRAVDKASDTVKDTKQTLSRLLGSAAPAAIRQPSGPRLESLVDDRFESLRRMVRPAGPGGPAPIDQTMALINELYQLMSTTETAVRSGVAPPASDVPNKIKSEAARLPAPMRTMLVDLASSGSTQALGATRANISQDLSSSIGDFCTRAITGRYPFDPSSTRDVTPEDFARLFGPGGVLDDFFQRKLASFVDTSTKPWRFRKVDNVSMGDSASLIQFQHAAEIRSVFFAAGARGPALRVEMKPVEMDPQILQFSLDVDGQVLRYAHGPMVPQSIQWPGPRKSNQIRIQISPPGTSGQSGLVFEGPWAIYRMFDRAQIDPGTQPEKFRASFSIDGRRIAFDVTTSSVQNPFRLGDLQAFRCPTRL